MQRLELGGLHFKSPLEMNAQELFSVLDCYSVKPVGNWPIQPELRGLLSHYQACSDLAHYLKLEDEKTVGEYILGLVSDTTARVFLEKILLEEK
ncbi:hypothetical protein EXS74_02205 [Candidatus Woesearchaeota archaeon]|nr:hypothetical protein [Candidatus Woesearchaeota archaeon]